MLSFAPPDAILSTAVDSFERTSSHDLQAFDSQFREIVHSSNRQSQILTMYDVFKRQANLLRANLAQLQTIGMATGLQRPRLKPLQLQERY